MHTCTLLQLQRTLLRLLSYRFVSLREPSELSQWLCHDVNIVAVIIIIIIIIIVIIVTG